MALSDKPEIAIVAPSGLGDAVVMLILANHLQRNHFRVTFYSDCAFELAGWLPRLSMRPLFEFSDIDRELAPYDLTITESATIIRHRYPESAQDSLGERYWFFSFGKGGVKATYKFDRTDALFKEQTSESRKRRLRPLVGLNGISLKEFGQGTSCAQGFALLCHEHLKFPDIDKEAGLEVPRSLEYRKHKRRVLIHPVSSAHQRDLLAGRALAFAGLLQKNGWEPVFIMTRAQYVVWKPFLDGRFMVPMLEKIHHLAAYIYESGFVVAVDSGVGHL
ncbi:MAG: hypothetical protein ACC652_11105, partial [Acidimicrobiales bacterium]